MENFINNQEKKRIYLLELARKMDQDAFEDLRCLYVNELPYSIKIETPIQLFHYLDNGDLLQINLLLHNLKSINLDSLIIDLEQYAKETTPAKDISLGDFFRIMKNGLRNIDVKKLNFLFGNTQGSSNFQELICNLVFYFGRRMVDWTSLWSKLSKVDEKLFKTYILHQLEEISKGWPKIDDMLIKEKLILLDISNSLSKSNLEELLFLYKIPISESENLTSGLDLINALNKLGQLSMEQLETNLNLIERVQLAQKLQKLKQEKILYKPSKKDEKSTPNVNNPLLILWEKAPEKTIIDLARSLMMKGSIQQIDELLIAILETNSKSGFDLTQVRKYLSIVERFDLIRISEKVRGQVETNAEPEYSKLPRNEYLLLQLIYKLDPIAKVQLAKAYGLESRIFNFTGELIHFMRANGLTDIDILKSKLRDMKRYDLIKCLEVPDRE